MHVKLRLCKIMQGKELFSIVLMRGEKLEDGEREMKRIYGREEEQKVSYNPKPKGGETHPKLCAAQFGDEQLWQNRVSTMSKRDIQKNGIVRLGRKSQTPHRRSTSRNDEKAEV